jgi:hypothetical protein
MDPRILNELNEELNEVISSADEMDTETEKTNKAKMIQMPEEVRPGVTKEPSLKAGSDIRLQLLQKEAMSSYQKAPCDASKSAPAAIIEVEESVVFSKSDNSQQELRQHEEEEEEEEELHINQRKQLQKQPQEQPRQHPRQERQEQQHRDIKPVVPVQGTSAQIRANRQFSDRWLQPRTLSTTSTQPTQQNVSTVVSLPRAPRRRNIATTTSPRPRDHHSLKLSNGAVAADKRTRTESVQVCISVSMYCHGMQHIHKG